MVALFCIRIKYENCIKKLFDCIGCGLFILKYQDRLDDALMMVLIFVVIFATPIATLAFYMAMGLFYLLHQDFKKLGNIPCLILQLVFTVVMCGLFRL